jgi:hypothetical protein
VPTPGHPKRTIRAPDDLWEAFVAACPPAERGRSGGAAKVLYDFMEWYVRKPGAKQPKRPAVAAWKGRQPKGDHDPGSSDTSR